MVYFFIIFLLSFLVYYYDYKNNKQGRLFWLVFITIIFIIIGGLHYRVGFDSITYERYFKELPPISQLRYKDIETSRFAPGFIIFQSFTKQFSKDLLLFNFLQSIFVCSVVTLFFNRNTKRPFFALLMFFFFLYTLLIFEQVREAIAVSFFLLAWPYFIKKNWIIWYALSICAMLFHTSAIFMLILPLILLPGINQLFVFGKRTLFLCAFVLILSFYLQYTFSKYIELLSFTKLTEDLASKYQNTHYVKGTLNIIGILSQIIKNVLLTYLALYFVNKGMKNQFQNNVLLRLNSFVIISIFISLISIGVPIISRFNNYFFFFSILIISDWVFDYIILNNKKIKFKFSYWLILLIPFFSLQFYNTYYNSINKTGTYKTYMAYYPYTSYIDKEKDLNKEKVLQYSRRTTK